MSEREFYVAIKKIHNSNKENKELPSAANLDNNKSLIKTLKIFLLKKYF